MAYKKFALYFKWIDQIVYEIITNQFTPFPVAEPLAYFYKSHFTITFILLILKTCLQKKIVCNIYREKKNIAKKFN